MHEYKFILTHPNVLLFTNLSFFTNRHLHISFYRTHFTQISLKIKLLVIFKWITHASLTNFTYANVNIDQIRSRLYVR